MNTEKTNNSQKKYHLTYENLPDLKTPHKVIMIYISQFLILVALSYFIWRISIHIWFGILIAQLIITTMAVLPVIYVTKNIVKIREKLKIKHGDKAFQNLYYRYLFFTQVPTFLSFYLPLILKTDYFLPKIINLPNHFMTNTLFPAYIALPLFIMLLLIGVFIRIPSGGFNVDVESYIYLMYPEKSKFITQGLYRYIRHPRYVGRAIVVLSFGFFANNAVALCTSIIHFIPFLILTFFEDNELKQRVGERYINYKKSVPAFVPHLKNWKLFTKEVFKIKK